MTNISEKILLAIIFIVLVGFNSVFILGQQNTVYNEKLESPQEINEEQAKEIALNVVNGVIKEVEERTVNGVSFYEVEIEDDTLETELKISKDGNIFQITQEEKDEEISQE
ncbi:MAG: PepSY domain-containing protein, partial [Nanoarchaeota archaeon]